MVSFIGLSYNGGTQTASAPAGSPASGDLYVAHVFGGERATVTPPAGWTTHDQAVGGDLQMAGLFYIIRGGSEPAFGFTGFVGSANCTIELLCYRGVDQTIPVEPLTQYTESRAVIQRSGDSTPDSPAVTTRVANSLLVCMNSDGLADPGTITIPSGMTSRYNKPSSDWLAGADQNIASIGDTGVRTWTDSAGPSLNPFALSVVIRPTAVSGAVSAPPFQNHRRFAYSRMMRG